jgi:hypothetical protein
MDGVLGPLVEGLGLEDGPRVLKGLGVEGLLRGAVVEARKPGAEGRAPQGVVGHDALSLGDAGPGFPVLSVPKLPPLQGQPHGHGGGVVLLGGGPQEVLPGPA